MFHLHMSPMFRRIPTCRGPSQVRIRHQGLLLPDLYPRPVSHLIQVSKAV